MLMECFVKWALEFHFRDTQNIIIRNFYCSLITKLMAFLHTCKQIFWKIIHRRRRRRVFASIFHNWCVIFSCQRKYRNSSCIFLTYEKIYVRIIRNTFIKHCSMRKRQNFIVNLIRFKGPSHWMKYKANTI